jgi:hypothetical protein
VQRFGIGQRTSVGQESKVSPRAIFFEQFYQQVERVSWSQQAQQQHTKQLGRRKKPMSSLSASRRKQAADKSVIQIRAQHFQKSRRACLRQGFHERKSYAKILTASSEIPETVFLNPTSYKPNNCNLFGNTLRRGWVMFARFTPPSIWQGNCAGQYQLLIPLKIVKSYHSSKLSKQSLLASERFSLTVSSGSI